MSDAPQELRRVNWSECFAFTQIFRAFGIARHPSKLALTFVAVLATYLAGRALDGLWSTASSPVAAVSGGQTELDIYLTRGSRAASEWVDAQAAVAGAPRFGVFQLLLNNSRDVVNQITHAVIHVQPGDLVHAIRRGLFGFFWMFTHHPGYGAIFAFLGMLIWAFLGGAVCRMAAMHAARDERISIRDALAFSRPRILAFLIAPLMPLIVFIVIGALMTAVSLIGAIPAVGELLVGLLFVLALIGGFALAFVFIGGVAGFSLTFPTLAVEASDPFDALSRTFSYIYQRPWRTTFYSLLALAYGAICLVFVKLFVRLMLWATHLCVGLTMNLGTAYTATDSVPPPKLNAIWQAPSLTGETPFFGAFDPSIQVSGPSWLAQLLIKTWIYLIWGLVASLAVSYFYSASTLIYLLLRREVDATDFEEVYIEDPLEDDAESPGTAPPAKPTGGTSLPVITA